MRSVEWFCVTSKKPLKCATPFSFTCLQTLFFLSSSTIKRCVGVAVWHANNVQKERGVLWNGPKAGGLSLRVKRDERVGVWWLEGVDVSVMAWCQTLCHCQSATSTHPSMVSHSPVCFKAIVLLPLQSVCLCFCVFFHNQK